MRGRIALAAGMLALAGFPAAAGASALVVSGSAAAPGAARETTLELRPGSVDATRIVLYAPAGATARLGGAAPGRAMSATLVGPGGAVDASGPLAVAAPGTEACGTTGHEAVWTLELGVASVPVAVDVLSPGDAEAVYGAHRLELCPPAGLALRALELHLDGVFSAPAASGAHVWRAVLDPGDPAAAVEVRSTELAPAGLSLRASYDRGARSAALTGVLTAGGLGLGGVTVLVRAGARASGLVPSGSVRTDSSGRFRAERALVRDTVFRVVATVPERPDPDGCTAPIAPGGCVSATLGPLSIRSAAVTVRVPAAPALRYGSRGADVRRLQQELVRLRYLPSGTANGVFGERTWHAVVAFQGWQRLGRTGVVDRRTWAALGRAGVPRPWGGLRRGVEVDVARQVLLLVRDGVAARAIHISSAAPGHWTPRGRYSVIRKEVLSWSVPFSSWMPYANYFTGGFAIHGYASVPSYPASHGCIRVPMQEAPAVYAAASYGSPVWVR
ncbi:MAG: murein L,D-transpeptidase [Thermoleophilia bacterium]|nr:murein L,D-transpeptidase [Thermoleophilia bacterium]